FNGQQGGQGAMGGAATGAAVGSVIPGVGTVIGAGAGAILGGALGGFGGSSGSSIPGFDRRGADFLAQIRQSQDPRSALQLGQMQTSAGGQQFRQGQMDLVRQLQQQAAGKGPSLAGMQAQ